MRDSTLELRFQVNESLFYCDGGKTLQQVVQRWSGVSTFEETQKPTARSPEQLSLGHPALSREAGLDDT